MRKDWERQKEKLFEELGRHQAGGSTQSFEATPRRKGAGGGYDRGVRYLRFGRPISSLTRIFFFSRLLSLLLQLALRCKCIRV